MSVLGYLNHMFGKAYSTNAQEYYEHIGVLHKTIEAKIALHSLKQSIFTQMMSIHASGMRQVVLVGPKSCTIGHKSTWLSYN